MRGKARGGEQCGGRIQRERIPGSGQAIDSELWPEMQPQASQRHHVHHPTYAPTSATPQAAETAEVPIGEAAESDETLGRPI